MTVSALLVFLRLIASFRGATTDPLSLKDEAAPRAALNAHPYKQTNANPAPRSARQPNSLPTSPARLPPRAQPPPRPAPDVTPWQCVPALHACASYKMRRAHLCARVSLAHAHSASRGTSLASPEVSKLGLAPRKEWTEPSV